MSVLSWTTPATSCGLRSPHTRPSSNFALRFGASAEELREAISSAIEEVDQLSALAENLLVIACSDKGGLALTIEPVTVTGLLEDLRERFAPAAAEAGRELTIEPADETVIEADRGRLEQALANLVENALRHGDGPIRIWSRAVEGRTELHVSDGGDGFAPEFLPHAFERFSRADAARSDGGTGLGLAIVAAIAGAPGGHASAGNLPGGGAHVWLEVGAPG